MVPDLKGETKFMPNLKPKTTFAQQLYPLLAQVNKGIFELEMYEFQYCLNNLIPESGWENVPLRSIEEIQAMVETRAFYDNIQIKPVVNSKIVLDKPIQSLTQELFAGLVNGKYSPAWVKTNFYFDIRGFYFLHRTCYYTPEILQHLGGKPYKTFTANQKTFETRQDISYKQFLEANRDLDTAFIECVLQLRKEKGLPLIIAIAGQTAAGKTEIVEQLKEKFESSGLQVSSIELDNFLTDRDYRELKGIFTQGKQAFHFDLMQQALVDIQAGKRISIPRYDFVEATSSHDLQGVLKPAGKPIKIEPADIIFIEGNFPFLEPEIARLIGIKVVYLTDDEVRLKRKWKRDIDYRKKYEPNYFRNRFFKDQFIMAEIAYRPQMASCDILVDTTAGKLWVTPEVQEIIKYPRFIKYYPQNK
jgi:uridine kinase